MWQALARPYLAAMNSVPATLRIGVHLRMGDAAVVNAEKKDDKRYRDGCAGGAKASVCSAAGSLPMSRLERRLPPAVMLAVSATAAPWGPPECVTCGRAGICWVRQAVRECDAVFPRRCMVWLASDNSQVRAGRSNPCGIPCLNPCAAC